MAKSILQSVKECYLCRRDAELLGYGGDLTSKGLHEHHIMYGTAGRQQSEKYGLKVWLCVKHHNEDRGLYAVHFNKEVNLRLRMDAERAFLQAHTFDEWMRVFGQNYLDEAEIKNAEKTKCESAFKTATIDKMGTVKPQNEKNGIKTECPEGFWFIE